MKEKEIRAIFERTGAIINGHFVFTSGLHSETYVNKDAIYPHTTETSTLCYIIAKAFMNDCVQVVIAPAIGGVILSQWIAYHLSKLTENEVLGVYAEKAEDRNIFVINRGYANLLPGKNVLVVEDVLTTGGSAKKVIEATRAIGGNVIGLGALCNRGNITPQDVADVPRLFALINVKMDAYAEENCPLCAKNIPINTNVGKGKEYLARKNQK